MAIDRKTVEHVANLSRLEMTPEELERYEKQLGAILEYIEQLRELDVTGAEPMAHPGDIQNVFRPDEPKPGVTNEEALRNAPEKAGPYFVVPRILE